MYGGESRGKIIGESAAPSWCGYSLEFRFPGPHPMGGDKKSKTVSVPWCLPTAKKCRTQLTVIAHPRGKGDKGNLRFLLRTEKQHPQITCHSWEVRKNHLGGRRRKNYFLFVHLAPVPSLPTRR